MPRDGEKIANKSYDIIVIGGGISGLAIAYEAALRGYRTLLLEKKDFGWATSSATSKMVHGGLRYLKQYDFRLVRESLRERSILMRMAPHLIHPFPFLLPVYQSRGSKFILGLGLWLYDLLSYDKGPLFPNHRRLNVQETLQIDSNLSREKLLGSFLYYDAQMPDPGRINLAFARSAAREGADILNHAEVVRFSVVAEGEMRTIDGLTFQDKLTRKEYFVKGGHIINAVGPWADHVLSLFEGKSPAKILRSKGVHLVTKKIDHGTAVALITKTGRHFFLLPWREYSIIGPTDDAYHGSLDEIEITESDIDDLLQKVNENYNAQLNRSDIQYVYAGLRPLVERDTSIHRAEDSYHQSRRHETLDHIVDLKIHNLVSVLGGKYTTSRFLAEGVITHISKKTGHQENRKQSQYTTLVGGDISSFDSFLHDLQDHKILSTDLAGYLAGRFGSELFELLSRYSQKSDAWKQVSPDYKTVWAEVYWALEMEMAVTLEDMIFRRTELGTAGNPGQAVLNAVAKVMAPSLGWREKERKEQVKKVESAFPSIQK